MAVDHFAVTSDQTGNFEPEFQEALAHTIYRRIIFAGVARIQDQLVDGLDLDFHGYFSWTHNALFSVNDDVAAAKFALLLSH